MLRLQSTLRTVLQWKNRSLCLPDAVYDLVIGNVSGALPTGKLHSNLQLTSVAVTRNGTKGLGSDTDAPGKIERKQLIHLQNSDEKLQKLLKEKERGNESTFEIENEIVYEMKWNKQTKCSEKRLLIFSLMH